MFRKQKNPLRPILEEERQQLTRLSRGQAIATGSVARAKALLAIADGDKIKGWILMATSMPFDPLDSEPDCFRGLPAASQ